ncbi:MAG: GTP-binding protein [Promethearchaeota archaeon]
MINLKIIVCGAVGVGKTSLIHRYVNEFFSEDLKTTIGVDFIIKRMQFGKSEANLTLWDLAGGKKFRTFLAGYMAGTHGALLLADISNHKSFLDLHNWMTMITKNPRQISTILIISKMDLVDQAKISEEEIDQFVKEHKIDNVLRCSAKTGNNVEYVFEMIVQTIIDSIAKECPKCHEFISEEEQFCKYCGQKQEN